MTTPMRDSLIVDKKMAMENNFILRLALRYQAISKMEFWKKLKSPNPYQKSSQKLKSQVQNKKIMLDYSI
jgi:hypothetical protein